jgi:hypothetical protein
MTAGNDGNLIFYEVEIEALNESFKDFREDRRAEFKIDRSTVKKIL